MELHNQVTGDLSWCFWKWPPVENKSEANTDYVSLEGNSEPYCRMWTDAEHARFKNSNNRSFAKDARIRLDNLKSGCNSPFGCCANDGMLYHYNCQKDLWDKEESQEDQSALDLVKLLDIEDKDVQDEESWLYESPKKQACVEEGGSALRWCRHILDNPSPDMEAARRSLLKKLDQKPSSHFYRAPAVFHHHVGSSMDQTPISATCEASATSEMIHDSTSYRLQDITDVHIMARIQEASLRQDYVSMPAGRSPESPLSITPLSSSLHQSPTPTPKRGCQSPKLARLHQQVTQFKLLKLAQSRASPPCRTRSPLQTSLRSLQAVRNSRSLDTEDCQSADQITQPSSGVSSVKKAAAMSSTRVSSDRTTAVKRQMRSQSLSPHRIPYPAAGYLPAVGRVFASPDRSASVAWGRNVPSTRR